MQINTNFLCILRFHQLISMLMTQLKISSGILHNCLLFAGDNSSESCIKFIRGEFLQRKPEEKQVYPHVSCAIDVELMKKMIDDVLQIIIQINLRKAAQVY